MKSVDIAHKLLNKKLGEGEKFTTTMRCDTCNEFVFAEKIDGQITAGCHCFAISTYRNSDKPWIAIISMNNIIMVFVDENFATNFIADQMFPVLEKFMEEK